MKSEEIEQEKRRSSINNNVGYRHSTTVAIGFLAVVSLVYYLPLLSGQWTFPDGDFNHHFLPFAQFLADSWRAPRLPTWNPYTYSGHPFWADVQSAVLYPISNLVLLATLPVRNDAGRLYLLQVEAWLHVWLAGVFVFLLARDLIDRVWPAILAAITFMLSGYLAGYPPLQLAVLRTAIWLPLLLWLLLRAWQEPTKWRYWIGAGAVTACSFLAGHTQTWLFIVYAAIGWVVALSFGVTHSGAKGSSYWRTRSIGLGIAGAVALGLMAAQLLPSIEYARLTVRADADYAFLSGGFPIHDTWQLLLPGVFTQYSPIYVGVISLGLAIFAVAAVYIAPKTATLRTAPMSTKVALAYFAILALVSLLLSYGGNGFLYPIFYHLAPGWRLFRGQERIAYLVDFALSLLAGYGLSLAPTTSLRLRRRFTLIYTGAVLAGVYVFGLLWQLPNRTVINDWRFLLMATTTLALAMALAMALWWRDRSVRREMVLCLLVIGNLFLASVTTNLVHRSPADAVRLPPEVVALRAAMAGESDASGLPVRAYNEYRVYANYGMQAGVEDVWGSSPLRLSTYDALFQEFPLDRMFRLTGVEYLLTWRKELFEPSELLAEFPQTADTTYLHRLVEPNPRVWLVDSVVNVDSTEEAVALLADHEFSLDERVVAMPGHQVDNWSGSGQSGSVSATGLDPRKLHIEITDSSSDILVVSENWMPGWRMQNLRCEPDAACGSDAVHDSRLPMLQPFQADIAFVGVALPVGDISFDLVYEPLSIRVGLVISGITLLILLIAGVMRFLASRRRVAAIGQ